MEQSKKKQCFNYHYYYYCYLFFMFMYIRYVCFKIIVFNMFRFIFMFKLECPNEKIIISHFLLLFLKPMDGTSQFICSSSNIKCLFGFRLKSQLNLLFSLFLLLFMSLILIYYLAYFCYYLWVSLHFLILFMGFTVLFQQTFTFMYSTFSKKFSVSAK